MVVDTISCWSLGNDVIFWKTKYWDSLVKGVKNIDIMPDADVMLVGFSLGLGMFGAIMIIMMMPGILGGL
jgi:hypothetical protein